MEMQVSAEVSKQMTKQQHYVTRGYLEGFADRRSFFALRKSDGKAFAANPRKVAVQRYLYESELTDTTEEGPSASRFVAPNHVERGLSQVEGECLRAISSVCSVALERKKADEALLGDIDTILSFAVQTIQRGPYALGELRGIVKDGLGGILTHRAFEMSVAENLSKDLTALKDEAANRFILLDHGMGRLSERIVSQWRGCRRVLGVAPPDAHFITSDLPVLGEGISGGRPVVLYMPLSARVGILFDRTHPVGGVWRLAMTKERVESVNAHFLDSEAKCEYLYGQNREHLVGLYKRAHETDGERG
jgi:hypothetical protein